jgi:endo-1,4-beta-mannosidase
MASGVPMREWLAGEEDAYKKQAQYVRSSQVFDKEYRGWYIYPEYLPRLVMQDSCIDVSPILQIQTKSGEEYYGFIEHYQNEVTVYRFIDFIGDTNCDSELIKVEDCVAWRYLRQGDANA